MISVDEMIRRECTIFYIEEAEGKRWVHYMGYGYYAGEPENQPYRLLEYTHCTGELSHVLSVGLKKYEEEYAPECKQYIANCDYTMLKSVYQMYDCGNAPKQIKAENIDIDTPCGCYVLTE